MERNSKGRFVGREKQEYICKYCNRRFIDFESNKRIFCNKICADYWKRINYLGERNHFYGKHHNIEIMKKSSEKRFKTPKNERKEKYCIVCNNPIKKSNLEPWKKYLSKKFCSKICSSKYYSGDKCNFWEGGVDICNYPKEFNNSLKRLIRKRDNQVCMNCGIHREKLNRALDIHHIDYNKDLIIQENLISLCRKCHALTHFNREYWTKLFQEKLSRIYLYKYSKNNDIILNLNERGLN